MSEIKTKPATPEYRLGWELTFRKKERCPICLGRIPYEGGPLPVKRCECGNCKCDGCIEARRRDLAGLPPDDGPKGGIISPVPAKEE